MRHGGSPSAAPLTPTVHLQCSLFVIPSPRIIYLRMTRRRDIRFNGPSLYRRAASRSRTGGITCYARPRSPPPICSPRSSSSGAPNEAMITSLNQLFTSLCGAREPRIARVEMRNFFGSLLPSMIVAVFIAPSALQGMLGIDISSAGGGARLTAMVMMK